MDMAASAPPAHQSDQQTNAARKKEEKRRKNEHGGSRLKPVPATIARPHGVKEVFSGRLWRV
jgi:hypothetical protein